MSGQVPLNGTGVIEVCCGQPYLERVQGTSRNQALHEVFASISSGSGPLSAVSSLGNLSTLILNELGLRWSKSGFDKAPLRISVVMEDLHFPYDGFLHYI